jgi:TATA-box binding protein (TBP) (component of TFIID and TFIIIB)
MIKSNYDFLTHLEEEDDDNNNNNNKGINLKGNFKRKIHRQKRRNVIIPPKHPEISPSSQRPALICENPEPTCEDPRENVPSEQKQSITLTMHITNWVVKFETGITLDLKKLEKYATRFNSHALTFHLEGPPSCRANVFPSGKVNVHGARTEDDCRAASQLVLENIQRLGYPGAKMKNFRKVSVAAEVRLGFDIDLEALNLFCQKNICNGEMFVYKPNALPPSISLRPEKKVQVSIFPTGTLTFRVPTHAVAQNFARDIVKLVQNFQVKKFIPHDQNLPVALPVSANAGQKRKLEDLDEDEDFKAHKRALLDFEDSIDDD